jgi:hypothetical protein
MQGKEQLTEMLELTENADKLGLTDKEFKVAAKLYMHAYNACIEYDKWGNVNAHSDWWIDDIYISADELMNENLTDTEALGRILKKLSKCGIIADDYAIQDIGRETVICSLVERKEDNNL